MSEYFSRKWAGLEPYVPGEQPRDAQYVKLNTNESPYPPSPVVTEEALSRLRSLNLYPDPTYTELRESLARVLTERSGAAIRPQNITVGNGSDEILNWAFAAFCDEGCPAMFADITYGFYPVFAANNRVPYVIAPLDEAFCIRVEDYCQLTRKTVFIANPNAPTGRALALADIERIVAANAGNVVVVDEAYVDFGAESAVSLVPRYPNLLVTQTFSKSRSLAGGRLGFAVAQAPLIADLETLRNSTNPYNVNNATVAWAVATLAHDDIVRSKCALVMRTRAMVAGALEALGFYVVPSSTNFLFVRHPLLAGETIYRELKARGVLVRHFTAPRISEFNRITVGTRAQMDVLLVALEDILAAAGAAATPRVILSERSESKDLGADAPHVDAGASSGALLPFAGTRALLVEDNAVNQEIMLMILVESKGSGGLS